MTVGSAMLCFEHLMFSTRSCMIVIADYGRVISWPNEEGGKAGGEEKST